MKQVLPIHVSWKEVLRAFSVSCVEDRSAVQVNFSLLFTFLFVAGNICQANSSCLRFCLGFYDTLKAASKLTITSSAASRLHHGQAWQLSCLLLSHPCQREFDQLLVEESPDNTAQEKDGQCHSKDSVILHPPRKQYNTHTHMHTKHWTDMSTVHTLIWFPAVAYISGVRPPESTQSMPTCGASRRTSWRLPKETSTLCNFAVTHLSHGLVIYCIITVCTVITWANNESSAMLESKVLYLAASCGVRRPNGDAQIIR